VVEVHVPVAIALQAAVLVQVAEVAVAKHAVAAGVAGVHVIGAAQVPPTHCIRQHPVQTGVVVVLAAGLGMFKGIQNPGKNNLESGF